MSQSPQGDIQERIAAARREAESLKEKIRAKRESSADTSCEHHHECWGSGTNAEYAPCSEGNGR